MKFAGHIATQMLFCLALGIPTYANSVTNEQELFNPTNFGSHRSIYQHQPKLSYYGNDAEAGPIFRTNIFALLARPADYAGKKVAFTGHFGRESGCGDLPFLRVYATDDDRRRGILNDGFRIFLKPGFQNVEQVKSGDVIDVVGVFKPSLGANSAQAACWLEAGTLESASIRIVSLLQYLTE